MTASGSTLMSEQSGLMTPVTCPTIGDHLWDRPETPVETAVAVGGPKAVKRLEPLADQPRPASPQERFLVETAQPLPERLRAAAP